MSLINDALRKAQSERGHPTSGTPPITPPGAPHHSRPSGASATPWIAIAVACLLLLGGLVIWLALRGPSSTQTAAVSPPTPTEKTISSPLPVETPSIVAETPATNTTAKLPPLVAPPAPEKLAEPIRIAPPPLPAVSPPPLDLKIQLPAAQPTPAPEPTTEKMAPPARQQDPRILAFIESLHLGALRATAEDARVVLNNKVYRAGSTVSRDLKLKLLRIEATRLLFTDEFGIEYARSLEE